ncbi:MAG: cytidine deaminase [Bacillota bacterium]|nr:cytidine deaminase [Bacillota bacterium]MDW7683483.1 cytidine deaminase [Bacillota bacterium]
MDVFTKLIESARQAREMAYSPYSRFPVGAALLADNGEIHLGSNVENLSYGLSMCAERNAVFTAVAAGNRKFTGMAVVADTPEPVTPCGACRQVLSEFSPDLWIVCANLKGQQRMFRLRELLPDAFEAELGE